MTPGTARERGRAGESPLLAQVSLRVLPALAPPPPPLRCLHDLARLRSPEDAPLRSATGDPE